MAQTSHGIGGLTFDAKKRARPPELNVFFALMLIVAVFEALGWLLMGDSFLFNTRENATSIFNTARLSIIILQVSIIGIIAIGVTQVIISGGIDLSSGSVVGATAMIAMSFAQVSLVNGQPNPKMMLPEGWQDLPVIVPLLVGLACGLIAGVINGALIAYTQDPAVHRHARHDGDRPRPRPLVVEGRADQLPDRGLRRHRQGHDAGLHLHRAGDPVPPDPEVHGLRQAHLRHRLERGGGADVGHQGRPAQGDDLRHRRPARLGRRHRALVEEPDGAGGHGGDVRARRHRDGGDRRRQPLRAAAARSSAPCSAR